MTASVKHLFPALQNPSLYRWLLLGAVATLLAFLLGMTHRIVSLALFPYVWSICAAPDYLAAWFLKPLAAVASMFIPGSLNLDGGSLILAGTVFGQFIVYALIMYRFRRKNLVRTAFVVAVVHMCFVGIALSFCLTRGWPDKSDEGQHALDGGEVYPNK